MINTLCIIQARINSGRLPNKVMQLVGNKTMLRRVWDAATTCPIIDKTVVAWPERYPDLDENNVLERFRRIAKEFPSKWIIRLTADCPLLHVGDIWLAAYWFKQAGKPEYYSNHKDGHDVQIFKWEYLWTGNTSVEHVIADFTTKPTGLSVNTVEDLERVRKLCKIE